MTLLVTRPRYDIPTGYLFHWSKIFLTEAKRRNLDFLDLKKDKANRNLVESYLIKQNPDIVIFNGHGNNVSIAGQDDETLISVNVNDHLLKDKIIFVRACSAAKILGPNTIKLGAKGFVGYKELFVFLSGKDSSAKPLHDEIARPFLECSNQVGLSLIKGHPANTANENSIKVYQKVISKMLNSEVSNVSSIPFLVWNMMNQVSYG